MPKTCKCSVQFTARLLFAIASMVRLLD
jgi:hypothetical protein